ncbi:Gfo/Idh/MocA family oxidoreductase [Botrimarina sp.]|uniref:Gfo/Idh/MocA family protein n=1 Tax=Botrimarina sp. TaxID=2795802 RepID=UPI0032EF3688
MNRRVFLSGAAASAASPLLAATPAARPLRVGLIGAGWYGKTDLLHLMQVAPVEVVGLCDVDRQMLDAAASLIAQRQTSGKRPPTYGDHLEMLRREGPEVVLVATPDHWHCLPMIDAVRSGADVYVQKPISYDVVEGQAMVAAARKYGRTVQVGLQRRSTPHLLDAKKRFVDSGKIGGIHHAEVYAYYGRPGEFPPPTEPPEHLDWERYVGPASWRDYSPKIHPRSWRACGEFSNGKTGDLCVHFLDVVRQFLGLGWPRRISATGGRLVAPADSNVNVHDTQNAQFDFGHTQVIWTQRDWGLPPDPQYRWGATLFGENGTLRLSIHSWDYQPKNGEPEHGDWLDESDEFPEDKQHQETELFAASGTRAHLRDFLAARTEQRRPAADIEEGHISTACCLLANLSMRLGRGLQWDAAAGRVVDDPQANEGLARAYRSPWEHPTPETV